MKSSQPSQLAHTACAFAILAGTLLPALFYVGYKPFDLEVLIVAAGTATAAVVIASLPVVAAATLLSIPTIVGGISYYAPTLGFAWQAVVAITILSVFVAWRWTAGIIMAIAAISGTVAAAISAPEFWSLERPPASRVGNNAAVIHLLLDEYAGPAGLPKDVLGAEKVEDNTKWYLERGFTIFERAFSDYGQTIFSLAQLANASATAIKEMVEPRSVDGNLYITRADTFAQIASRWQVRTITTSYASLQLAFLTMPFPPGTISYNGAIPSPVVQRLGVPITDRLQIMMALIVTWASNTQKIGPIKWWLDTTVAGRSVNQFAAAKDRLHAAGSMVVLDRLINEEIPRLQRGQYLFAHVLLPHYPYIFDQTCALRPVADWRNRAVAPGETDTMSTRAERYRLYIEQMACARHKLDQLLAAIARNAALADATIVIHGDHGSRIAIESWKTAGAGYDESAYLRDWHAAHFVVRLPGVAGTRIAPALAIHDIFAALVSAQFADVNLKSMRSGRPMAARLFGAETRQ